MEELEKLKSWLTTYPGWGGEVLVDHTRAVPGHFGLYPQGVRQLSRKEDVLGNARVRLRGTFELYRVTTGQADNAGPAGWLLEFQEWVRQQSESGLAPRFGEDQQIRAEQGRLQKASQPGTGTYAVTITVEYTETYEAEG